MARYDFDPSKVTTGFVVYDEGPYEAICFDPATYHYDGGEGKTDRDGIKFSFQFAEGDQKGKMVTFMPNFNDDFGMSQAKAVVMAALGYDPNKKEDEDKFNSEHGEDEWGLDTAAGFIGTGWTQIKGKRIGMQLGVNIAKDGSGKKYQKFSKFYPI